MHDTVELEKSYYIEVCASLLIVLRNVGKNVREFFHPKLNEKFKNIFYLRKIHRGVIFFNSCVHATVEVDIIYY